MADPKMSRAPFDLTRQVPEVSKWNDIFPLLAGVADTYVVPATADFLEIKYTAGILWQNPNGVAAAPAEALDGSGSELVLQGQAFTVSGGESLSFFNETACFVQICCKVN